MTESERPAAVHAKAKADHQAALPVWFIVALILSLVLNVGLWWNAQARADRAEQSKVSLAEQIQARCDELGSLQVGDRELCKRAEAVVENPATPVPPVTGAQGIQGPRGFTGAQGIQGREGPPGERGPRGRPGKDGMAGRDGADSTVPGPRGATGADGKDGATGATGAAGRGIQSMQCATGGWIITYTDGVAAPPGGPCRGPQGEPGKDSTVPGPKGDTGDRGPQGTARPGAYTCDDGEYVGGFTVADDGGVTLACRSLTPAPLIETPGG